MTATVSTLKTENQRYEFKVKNRGNSKEEGSWMGLMKDHSAADAEDDWTQEFGTQGICSLQLRYDYRPRAGRMSYFIA